MKTFSTLTIGLGLLLGSGVAAMAGIVTNNANLTNYFGPLVTSDAVSSIDSLSIDVTTPDKQTAFTATPLVDDYLPMTFGTGNTGVSKSADLDFGVSDSVPPVTHTATTADLVATPEPSGLPFLGAGALVIGMLVRRKLLRVS